MNECGDLPQETTAEHELEYSQDTWDIGDNSYKCKYCKTFMWSNKRLAKSKRSSQPDFSLYCMEGKVQLPLLKYPPQELVDLHTKRDLRSQYFLKNIRAFNAMFSFTSMAGKVDHDINNSSAPPIFLLGGQNFHSIGSLLPDRNDKPRFAHLYIYDTENEIDLHTQELEGKVQLSLLKYPPQELVDLHTKRDLRSQYFLKNIRAFNAMFSFTSMAGKVDHDINNGSAPPIFLLGGQNFHSIGSLLPDRNDKPRFAHLYIYDIENEIDNRINTIRLNKDHSPMDVEIVTALKIMLDVHNELAKSFRYARDRYKDGECSEVRLRLIPKRDTDGRTYNLSTASEVDAVIVGDIDTSLVERDAILETKSRLFRRVDVLHPQYLGFQYPLLFPYGEDGYRHDILQAESSTRRTSTKWKNITMREFLLSKSKIGLHECLVRGETEAAVTGQRIILPSSFTGGPRHFGYPSFFITMTCNPEWLEIKRYIQQRGIKAEDRPYILCRVFKIKLDELIQDLKRGHIFGKLLGYVCTIEFQKRGLPHAHILLFMHSRDNPKSPDDIDKFISAEIPDKEENPMLFNAVEKFMVHGPCGNYNRNSPCMKNRKSSKHYPKSFRSRTVIDDEGFPKYRRRDNGKRIKKKNCIQDNTFIVPYNSYLLMKYRYHINVEYTCQTSSIKYLFKYVHKGNDKVTATLFHPKKVGEIQNYYDCRYISACEASWRLFSFDIQY